MYDTSVAAAQLDSQEVTQTFGMERSSADLFLLGAAVTQQLAVAVTSSGLFKEWVTTETPGRLPLGPVVLLGRLSGRPIVLVCVCVCAHLCLCGQPVKGQHGRLALIFSVRCLQ